MDPYPREIERTAWRRAAAKSGWQMGERCVCQTHAGCVAYAVFLLYSLLLMLTPQLLVRRRELFTGGGT